MLFRSATGTYAGMSVGTATFASFANVQTQTGGVNAVSSGTLNFITTTGSGLTRSITNNGGKADLILNTDGSVMKTGSFFVSGGTFTSAANGGTLTIPGGGAAYADAGTNFNSFTQSVTNFIQQWDGGLTVSNGAWGHIPLNFPDLRGLVTNDPDHITRTFKDISDTNGFLLVNRTGFTLSATNGWGVWSCQTNQNINQASCAVLPLTASYSNSVWTLYTVFPRPPAFNQFAITDLWWAQAVQTATNSSVMSYGWNLTSSVDYYALSAGGAQNTPTAANSAPLGLFAFNGNPRLDANFPVVFRTRWYPPSVLNSNGVLEHAWCPATPEIGRAHV